jgi:hypothetical protein
VLAFDQQPVVDPVVPDGKPFHRHFHIRQLLESVDYAGFPFVNVGNDDDA